MFGEYFKKPSVITNKRLTSLKILFSKTTHNQIKRKTIFASICILTLITLLIVVGDFGSIKSFAKADSVLGIGVGIYWNKDCTNTTNSLNWGFINPNSYNNLTIFIQNEGNSAASLRLVTSNWAPTNASNYMSLSWNYSGQILRPNEVIPVRLTLTVSPKIVDITDFSFETTITTFEA
jgi:hypothetical protein